MQEKGWVGLLGWGITVILLIVLIRLVVLLPQNVAESIGDDGGDPGTPGPIIIVDNDPSVSVNGTTVTTANADPNNYMREDMFGPVYKLSIAFNEDLDQDGTLTAAEDVNGNGTTDTLFNVDVSSIEYIYDDGTTIVVSRSGSSQLAWELDGTSMTACKFGGTPACTGTGVPIALLGTLASWRAHLVDPPVRMDPGVATSFIAADHQTGKP